MQLQDYADEEIDSCDTGLITRDGEEINEGTVGDVLCERLFNHTFPDEATRIKMYEKPWNTGEGVGTSERGLRACGEKPPKDAKEKRKTRFNCLKELNEAKYPPVYIGAYHSYCGTDWQEVATGSGKSRKPLNLKKTLCCQKKPDPVCKDGKILKTSAGSKGLARKLNTKKGQTCADFPLGFGCPCPELPMKPKYVTCEYLRGYNSKCAKKK